MQASSDVGSPFRGVIPAIVSPFRDDGSLCTTRLGDLARRMLAAGCTGTVWPGSLGEGQALYLLPCTGGAYNRFYSVYLADGAGYQRLDFATPTYSAGWQAEPGIWLESFDHQTLELRSSNLGRGMGDCGMRGRWQWNGSRFVMLDYTLQAACDASVEPGDFPLVYRNPAADLPD